MQEFWGRDCKRDTRLEYSGVGREKREQDGEAAGTRSFILHRLRKSVLGFIL